MNGFHNLREFAFHNHIMNKTVRALSDTKGQIILCRSNNISRVNKILTKSRIILKILMVLTYYVQIYIMVLKRYK